MNKLCILLFSALALSSAAQDPHFSQFHNNGMYLNPAFAGSRIAPEVAVNYRNQWPGLSGNYVTTLASYSQYLHVIHGAAGVYSVFDHAGGGTISSLSFNAVYAYRADINKLAIQVAATAGYRTRHLDWSKLTFGDMIDPRYGFVYPNTQTRPKSTIHFWDYGLGIIGYTKNLYGGFAVDHLTEPSESFIEPGRSKLPRRYSWNAGFVVALDDSGKLFINPDIIYQRQHVFSEWIYGMTVKYAWVRGGIAIRRNDAVVLSAGIEVARLSLSYSYDHTTSALAVYSGGSHEITASYRFINKSKPLQKMALPTVAF